MNAKEIELRNFTAEWVELPTPGSGNWFFRITDGSGGDGKVVTRTLTKYQAEEVARVAGERK